MWLVRRKNGEIIGPFSQSHLVEASRRGDFLPEDEMAPSLGEWISADHITEYDGAEFTQTSTKTANVQKTIQTSSTTDSKDIGKETEHKKNSRLGLSLIIVSCLIFLSLGCIFYLVNKENFSKPTQTKMIAADTPFILKVKKLINDQQKQEALRLLTQYHQTQNQNINPKASILYASLLITENESVPRGKSILTELMSHKISDEVISDIQHWLAYIDLMESKNSFGAQMFHNSLKLNPKNSLSRFNLAKAFEKMSSWDQVIETLEKVPSSAKTDWLVQNLRGKTKAQLNQVSQARFAYMSAIQNTPDRWQAYTDFALFLSKINEVDMAQNMLLKMLTRDPHYEAQTPAPYGFFQQQYSMTQTLEIFNSLMKTSSTKIKALGRTYISYLIDGPSSSYGDRLLKRARSGDELFSQVIGLKVLLDRKATIAKLKDHLNLLQSNLSDFGYYAYVLRGEALLRMGKKQQAGADFLRATRLEPKSAIARLAYAQHLKQKGEVEDSSKQVDVLRKVHPLYIPTSQMFD